MSETLHDLLSCNAWPNFQCAALLLQRTKLTSIQSVAVAKRHMFLCTYSNTAIYEQLLSTVAMLTECLTSQYMSGGDLVKALSRDMAENGDGPRRQLSWYAHGRFVLLSVARGLAYLHHLRVRKHPPCVCLSPSIC